VHLAKLRGEAVVVKVQRPGLKALFDIDLKNIRVLAQWLQRLDPQSDGAARDWVAIYDECSRILYQEIDYRLEGQNADRFRCHSLLAWLYHALIQRICCSVRCWWCTSVCNTRSCVEVCACSGKTSLRRTGLRCPRSTGSTPPARC
jgi:ABC1 atypical kinase-like domain